MLFTRFGSWPCSRAFFGGDGALPVADLVSAVRSLSIADPRGLSAVVLLLRSSARFLRQGGRPAGRGACSNRGVAAKLLSLPSDARSDLGVGLARLRLLLSGWIDAILLRLLANRVGCLCRFAGGRTVGSLVLQLYD